MRVRPGSGLFGGIAAVWAALGTVAAVLGPRLDATWPLWRWAFGAAATWALIAGILDLGTNGDWRWSRVPVLAAAFGLVMTVFGTGSYWVTNLLFPGYRTPIEKAAFLVAICLAVSLASAGLVARARSDASAPPGSPGMGLATAPRCGLVGRRASQPRDASGGAAYRLRPDPRR
jgi:hypothetical protein